jgi:hypothetical protein
MAFRAAALSSLRQYSYFIRTFVPVKCHLCVSIRTFVPVKQEIEDLSSVYACLPPPPPRLSRSTAPDLHTSTYVSIRLHTSSYVSIRQHTSSYVFIRPRLSRSTAPDLHTSAYVSIRLHTSAYASIRERIFVSMRPHAIGPALSEPLDRTSAC